MAVAMGAVELVWLEVILMVVVSKKYLCFIKVMN